MNRTLQIVFIIALSFASCSNRNTSESKKSSEQWIEIRDSADWFAFNKFILDYPNSEKFDSALYLKSKYWKIATENEVPPPWDCFRNCFQFNILRDSSLTCEYEIIDILEVYPKTLEFFENQDNSKALSDKEEIERSLYTAWKISEGFVVIFYELVEKNDTLKDVLLNVIDATNEYKNIICRDWYNLDYNKLSVEDKSYVDSFFMNWNRIHLMEYSTDYLEYIRKNKQ